MTASAQPDSADIQWLSTGKAAERLGINTRTLYRLIDQGQIAAYRFGRVMRLRASDVEEFIVASKVGLGELRHLYDPDAVAVEDANDSVDGGDTSESGDGEASSG